MLKNNINRNERTTIVSANENETEMETSEDLLESLFTTFANGLRSSRAETPRAYLKGKGLDWLGLNLGFNSGQSFHRALPQYIQSYLDIGFIWRSPQPQNVHRPAYSQFGIYSIIFPLRNEAKRIVNFYGIRIDLKEEQRAFWNDRGLYPGFPPVRTRKMYVTRDVLDAATLVQSAVPDNRESVVSLFDGELNSQHEAAFRACSDLEEIVLVGCSAGIASCLAEQFPDLTVSEAVLPEGMRLNDVWVSLGADAVQQIMDKRTYLTNAPTEATGQTGGLVSLHPGKLLYRGDMADWYVQGEVGMDLSGLPVTLKVRLKTGQVVVGKYDLYHVPDRHTLARELGKYGVSPHELESDLMLLILLLDEYRDEHLIPEPSTKDRRQEPGISHTRQRDMLAFLSEADLMERIDEQLMQAGIVGEEGTRLTVFVIASSCQSPYPLHCIVQGASGSGKTHLLSTIAACIPEEAVLSLTRLTNNSFYYLGNDELSGKLLLLHDLDGLSPESLYALRELQSAGSITHFRPYKDKQSGNIKTANTEIRGSFASLMATTKGTVYFDNLSRSILLGVSESPEQTAAIVEYQNRKRSGLVDTGSEIAARLWLQDMHRMLKPCEVINPYAHRLRMPVEGMLLRRLNDQFLSFTEQITRLHQYQREKDTEGRLITTVSDVRIACELFFEAIFLKVSDLDSSLLQFFERMKTYVKEHCPDGRFRQRDIRQTLGYSRTHVFMFFKELRQREYLRVVGGTANRGFIYEIDYWNDADRMKQRIKEALLTQVAEWE